MKTTSEANGGYDSLEGRNGRDSPSRVAMEETLSQGAKAETQEATVIMCNNRSMFPGELKLDRSAVETAAYGVGVSRYTDTIRIGLTCPN